MTHFLDLFSGIGGFALGAYWAGLRFDGHYYSEIDDYAIRVYGQRFPDAIGLGDITKIKDLPQGDWIISGGFPCQDISVAGKGAGLAGKRSGLWYEYARIIGELRPRYAIMENVGALSFRGLDAVLGSLAEIGYDAEWQDIRASDVGAPHRRERLWIIAYPSIDSSNAWRAESAGFFGQARTTSRGDDVEESQKTRNIYECGYVKAFCAPCVSDDVPDSASAGLSIRGRSEQPKSAKETRTRMEPKSERRCEDLSDSGSIRKAERRYEGLSTPSRDAGSGADNRNRTTFDECRKWWTTEPDVGRVATRLPLEMDGGIKDGQMATEKSGATSNSQNGQVRKMWSNGESSTASSRLQQAEGSKNTLPELPCESRPGGRDEAQEGDAKMRGMREDVCSLGFAQTQDLRLNLSSDPRTRKRVEAVAWDNEPDIGRVATGVPNRVNRLKCLGNSIVPQIAQLIFEQAAFDEWRIA